jgi:hypothetical protein
MDSIKAKSTMLTGNPTPTEDSAPIAADIQSAKLKQLLGQVKSTQ